MVKFLVSVLFLVTSTGCVGATHIKATPAGEAVQVVGTESAVAACGFVGNLTSRQGTNFRTFDTNIELAQIDLRNQAAGRGATHLLVGEPQKESTSSWGQCENCVRVSARAFKCK